MHGGSEAKQVSLIEDLDAREIGYNAIATGRGSTFAWAD